MFRTGTDQLEISAVEDMCLEVELERDEGGNEVPFNFAFRYEHKKQGSSHFPWSKQPNN